MTDSVTDPMTDSSIQVLLIEDDAGDADLLREILAGEKKFPCQVEWVDRLRLGLERLSKGDIQVVLLDLSLPDSHGLDTLTKVRSQISHRLPIVVLTGLDDESLAVKAVAQGAQDYVVKGSTDGRLLSRTIRYAMERSQLLTQLEEAHRAEIEERNKLDRMKDEFISTVSHELRTPLTLIRGSIENLEDGIFGVVTKDQAGVLRMMSGTIDRLTRIIHDLLDLSRLESGRAPIKPERIDAASLVRGEVRNFKPAADKKGIRLVCDLPEDLPSVLADPDLMIRVLDNLLHNALRFAKEEVVVRCRVIRDFPPGKRSLRFSVVDDGPGVAPPKAGLIFEKYVQLERQTGEVGDKGAGLGLAICKEIVERHRGKIWVESRVGEGARVHFLLPLD